MKVIDTEIPDVKIIEPKVFSDDRGFFFESFNKNKFEEFIGRSIDFIQDNQSHSVKGVLRGLHYQLPPNPQAKLVRCVEGEIFDVAVDIRQSSPTFSRWVGVYLSTENKRQLWIPEGFAHGFLALSEKNTVCYKVNEQWNPKQEQSIIWNDPDININWPTQKNPILSEKDNNAPLFKEVEKFI